MVELFKESAAASSCAPCSVVSIPQANPALSTRYRIVLGAAAEAAEALLADNFSMKKSCSPQDARSLGGESLFREAPRNGQVLRS